MVDYCIPTNTREKQAQPELMFVPFVVCVLGQAESYICTDRWRKPLWRSLKVKKLVARSDQAEFCTLVVCGGWWGDMMYSYIWVLFCSLVSGRYSAGNSPEPSLMADLKYKPRSMEFKNNSLNLYTVDMRHLSWHYVCCTPHADIMSSSGFDLTTERGTRT